MSIRMMVKGLGIVGVVGLFAIGTWGSVAMAGGNPHVAEAIAHVAQGMILTREREYYDDAMNHLVDPFELRMHDAQLHYNGWETWEIVNP